MSRWYHHIATKSDAEHEQEEAERLVRESPKKKPPRKDKERGRIEVKDEDLDNKDKDLSMNYKDIGGSIALASVVAYRYICAMSEEEFLNQSVKNPESGKEVKVKTLQTAPEGSKAKKRYEELRKQFEEESGEDDKTPKKDDPWGDDDWSSVQKEVQKDKKTPKEKAKDDDPWGDAGWEEEAQRRKKEKEQVEMEKREKLPSFSEDQPLSEIDAEQLYDVAEFGTEEQRQEALKEITKRKKPIPEDMPPPQEFKGELTTENIESLKNQVSNWNMIDWSQNMKSLEQDFLEAKLTGNEREAEYFEQIKQVYEDSNSELRTQSINDVEDVSELYSDAEGLQEAADEFAETQIRKKRPQWYQSMMFSPLNSVGRAKEKIEEKLETVTEGTREEAYLKELESLSNEVFERKLFDTDSSSGRMLTNIRDEAQSEGLKDIDPGEYDFTDPDQIDEFMGNIKNLSDSDIFNLVKDEPVYRMYFALDGSEQPENVSISSKDKNRFFNSLEEDLKVRGFYEQVRFHNDEDNQVFERGDLLKYRDELKENLEDNEENSLGGFWGTFLDWMSDMAEDQYNKNSSSKRAQYRGKPGPLADEDPYKPASPDWRLPVSTADLSMDDYMSIIREARTWLKSSLLTHRVVEEDFDMACRLALDYSIYTASDNRFNGAVGSPEYEELLKILSSLEVQ